MIYFIILKIIKIKGFCFIFIGNCSFNYNYILYINHIVTDYDKEINWIKLIRNVMHGIYNLSINIMYCSCYSYIKVFCNLIYTINV